MPTQTLQIHHNNFSDYNYNNYNYTNYNIIGNLTADMAANSRNK